MDTTKNQESCLHILIVEDEEYNYLFLASVLRDYQVKITRAYNGKMAVEQCQADGSIHLVLMDIRMPVMDGYEATGRIKKIRPDLPVIAQTAYAMETDRKKSYDAGCDDYLPKPIRKAELIHAIARHTPHDFPLKKKEAPNLL